MQYLLLPGMDGTGRLFDSFSATVPEGSSVDIASYPVDREMSYSDHAALVVDAFSPDEPFVIVAESFSGPIAVLAAATRLPNLAGIVLCNTFVYRVAWHGFSYLPWAWLFRFPITTLTVGIHLTGFQHASKWVQRIRAANQPVLPNVRASRLRSALTVDVRNEFAALDVPVMYLRGLQDRLVFSSCVRQATAARPSTTVVQVPGPHLLLQVEPQRSWQEVSSFVSSQCQP